MLAISPDPIDYAAVQAAVADDRHGAIGFFAGVVRNHHEGQAVTRIDYEVHAAMAQTILEGIAKEVAERWPESKMACVHRHGMVEVGEASVAIAVSAPHRREAIEACHYAIDELKVVAPIWKKEYFEGGEVWIGSLADCCHEHDGDSSA